MIMPMMKNLKGKSDLGDFHTMNWLMKRMALMTKKSLAKEDLVGFIRDI